MALVERYDGQIHLNFPVFKPCRQGGQVWQGFLWVPHGSVEIFSGGGKGGSVARAFELRLAGLPSDLTAMVGAFGGDCNDRSCGLACDIKNGAVS